MMDITPVVPGSRQLIQSYGDGGFRVSGLRHEGSLLVFPSRVVAWPVTEMVEISVESLKPVLEAEGLEILLVGCGERMQLLPSRLRQELRQAGIAVDVMDTGGACRTYNVLLGEGRRVAAAVIAV